MCLFGKRVFEDVAKDLERRSSWIIQEDSKSTMNDTLLLRRAEETHTQKENYMKMDVVVQCEGNVTMMAETPVLHLYTKERQGLSATTRSWETGMD